jgi:hypothetical protein
MLPFIMTNRLLLSFLVLWAVARLFAAEPLPPPQETEAWTPVPPVVDAPPGDVPSDAIRLFDGQNLDAWEPVPAGAALWKIEGDAFTVTRVAANKPVDLRTRQAFGDIQLHLEFRLPPAEREGQLRGNSGIFFMGLYELQILDSWRNDTYVNGQMASLYKQHAPLVNAARPPGEWQTLDVVFIAPRFNPDGALRSPARVTVFHNGVLVQHAVALKGPTTSRGRPPYVAHVAKLPLRLQDHRSPVSFRNIWVRELNLPVE